MNLTCPDEILWRHIRELPYFRAMVRAVEDSFYQGMDLPTPVLDVGCGDGQFASVAFDHRLDVGIDPWGEPIHEAGSRQVYDLLVQGEGAEMPFPDASFSTVISNSVLEHIPDVDAVVRDIARVIRPGGKFVFCVPNHRFPELLLGTTVFRRLKWESAAKWYSRLFNKISRHKHCDSLETWRARLDATGFEILEQWDYFCPKALHTMEVGHAVGLPALFWKKLVDRWILFPTRANLVLAWAITRPLTRRPVCADGVYSFYVTRKRE